MANKKEQSKFSRKVDAFCRGLFLTEEGKPKSATLLYSFCLSLLFFLVFLAVDVACVVLLKDIFTEATLFLSNLVEYLLPGTVAGLLCFCLCFLFREKKNLVPAAFTWLCVMTLAVMIVMLFYCDPAEGMIEFRLFFMIVLLPFFVFLAMGTLCSQLYVRNWKKKQKEAEENAPKRPSYYNT